ncbi:hypothetical protein [Phyllobacterium zundukense]|uniref:Uncharacterized protein n=1 Tax=Phyllobacterium zundukense TaxID=1867719 RepID=A0A2N9VW49_9HYPH|nr:hypothetical protein [Phyllobacterium zundukense]ATU91450.1 hypothetical protein BLM14_07260 [Phyllobacterium zundukense]PIO43717.1 hypothetical protein B5P45_17640 [Phyllobacterium zundukense]
MMLLKVDLLKLSRDTRAFTLVGGFMGFFALLEEGIGTALGEVLGVKGARRIIITRNMSFYDKIKTLRSLVNFYVVEKELADRFDELAQQSMKYGEMRNIIAHSPFRGSHASDGVEFFPITASSKLKMPDMDWSIDDFLDHIEKINKIDNELRSIEKRMPFQRIAEALLAGNDASSKSQMESPLSGLFGLGASFLNEQKP